LKKVTAILLSFLLFLSSSNYIFLFIERLETIKSEMNEKIFSKQDNSESITFKFSLNDFNRLLNWHDANEFELNGKMYDVIKIEECNGEYTVHCFNDEKEEVLISNFKKLNDRNGEQKNCITVQSSNFVMLAVKNDNPSFQRYYGLYSQPLISTINYHSISFDILTPPPKSCI
jgi:hypothetical protein